MSIQFSNAVWAANVADPIGKFVLLKLADNANDEGRCWPSIALICRETQLSERTVQRKLRFLESIGVMSSDRGKNRCDYFLKMDQLKAHLIDLGGSSHPVTQTPRHTDTSSHSHPGGVTQSLKGCHSDGGGCHSDSYLTSEPSINHHLTIIEPSADDLFSLDQEAAPLKLNAKTTAETIYQAYPKKVARPKALVAITKAMKRIDPAVLLERTMAYALAVSGNDRQFIPHPATWFNTERFDDDQSEWRQPSGQAKKSTLEKEYIFDDSYTTEIL